MTTITRSTGVPTGHAIAPLCGNGGRGATPDLDGAVAVAAEQLALAFPSFDITIRFNSDRLSGGAWLITSKGADRCGVNADVGLCSTLSRLDRSRASWERWHGEGWLPEPWLEYCQDRRLDPNGPNEQITHYAYLSRAASIHKDLPDFAGQNYFTRPMPSIHQGIKFLSRNAKPVVAA